MGFAQKNPKKGVWNFRALETPALIRLESPRHLFLGWNFQSRMIRKREKARDGKNCRATRGVTGVTQSPDRRRASSFILEDGTLGDGRALRLPIPFGGLATTL